MNSTSRQSLPSLLFWAHDGPASPPFHSQLLPLVVHFESRTDTVLIYLEDVKPWLRSPQTACEEHLEHQLPQTKLVRWRTLPLIGVPSLEWLAQRLAAYLQRQKSFPLVVHARTQLGSYVAVRARDLCQRADMRVVADLRGVMDDELARYAAPWMRWTGYSFLRQHAAMVAERESVRQADAILCVSEKYRSLLLERYPNTDIQKIHVQPSAVDTQRIVSDKNQREAARRTLGVEDRFVVVYSGSLASYEAPELFVDSFLAIRAVAPTSKLLVFTQHAELIKPALERLLATNDYSVVALSHKEVGGYLCAADLALLVRPESLTNYVASPVKFAEYLAAGVPVLVSKGIGDTAEIVSVERVGHVFGTPNLEGTVASIIAERTTWRERCVRVACDKFDLRTRLQQLDVLYRGLAG